MSALSKIGDKLGDIINPGDELGEAFAKGAIHEGLAGLRALVAEYPMIGAALKGQKVQGDFALNGGAPLSFTFQMRIVE